MEVLVCALTILAACMWQWRRPRAVPRMQLGFCETSVLIGVSGAHCSCGQRCNGLPLNYAGHAMYNMIAEHRLRHAR